MVALGSTTFDGLSRSTFWTNATVDLAGLARLAAFTAGLLAVIGFVTLAFTLAMRAAARVVDGDWHALAVRFAPSLVPIVLAYVIAHYFSFLVLEGQLGLVRLSDPFGLGWNLFGTERLGDQPRAAVADDDLVRPGRGDRDRARRRRGARPRPGDRDVRSRGCR